MAYENYIISIMMFFGFLSFICVVCTLILSSYLCNLNRHDDDNDDFRTIDTNFYNPINTE